MDLTKDNKIKLNNYFFEKGSDILECLNEVYLIENPNVKLNDLRQENKTFEEGVEQFELTLYNRCVAIVSIFINPINGMYIVNYQSIAKLNEFSTVKIEQDGTEQ